MNLESLKSSDIAILTHLQGEIVRSSDLTNPTVMTLYLRIVEQKSKLMGLEFAKLEKNFQAYRKLTDSLIHAISGGLGSKSSSDGMSLIANAMIEFFTESDSLVTDLGITSDNQEVIKLLKVRLESSQ